MELITAVTSAVPEGTAPREIVFLPEGRHAITPKSHPDGISVVLDSEHGDRVATAFNASLAKRGMVPAWCDFEHSHRHPVSFYPTSFRYEPGRGIMAEVEWSASGRAAVEGRNARFFSPEFFIDPDGVPAGLPSVGPVGGLTVEPAFRNIGPIAAAEASLEPVTASQAAESASAEDQRITAALGAARGSLPVSASFLDVWETAHEQDPAAFGLPSRDTGCRRISSALISARQEAGGNADFSTVWARAAELDPSAFT